MRIFEKLELSLSWHACHLFTDRGSDIENYLYVKLTVVTVVYDMGLIEGVCRVLRRAGVRSDPWRWQRFWREAAGKAVEHWCYKTAHNLDTVLRPPAPIPNPPYPSESQYPII